jgi:hypothetical protein
MKNIILLPTEKYTDIVHSTSKYGGLFLSRHYSPTKEMGDSYQHIYITSDEKIKEGDWCIVGNGVSKLNTQFTSKEEINTNWKKIILTTDQSLDGVQEIDDEFLQWFVQNPSCEWVEVESMINMIQFTPREFIYKIIIPQEETKLINNCPKCGLDLVEREGSKPVCHRVDCGGIILSNETLREWELKKEPKQEMAGKAFYESADKVIVVKRQETLEEAAERFTSKYYSGEGYERDIEEAVKFGAKWQAERMYSEEEVIAIVEKSRETGLTAEYLLLTEQFKKK